MNKLYSVFFLSVILSVASCGKSGSGDKTDQPMPENMSEGMEMPEDRLYFDMDMAKLEGLASGDTLTATLVAGDSYDLVVFRVEETMPGMLAIAANVDGDMEIGQAALIYRNSTLRGSVDMHRMGMKYQVYFDEDLGQHYLLPRTDDDEMEGSTPLTAPADELEQE